MLHDNYIAFKEVAETKNFSKAATKLYLSQPAITVKIKALEDYYGTKLFDRAKKIQLTEAGQILYNYVNKCLSYHEEAFETINTATGKIRGTLHLGATLTIGEYLLPRIIGDFIKEYQEVDCNLEIANTKTIKEKLLAGEIDVGLIEGPISHPQLIKESFLKDELVVVVPNDHRWAKKRFLTAAELMEEKLILRELDSGTRIVFDKNLRKKGLEGKVKIAMELGSTQAIKEAVLSGLGITVISECTVQREVWSGLLKTIKINDMALQRDLNIYYYKNHFKTKLTEVFVGALQNDKVKKILDLPLAE